MRPEHRKYILYINFWSSNIWYFYLKSCLYFIKMFQKIIITMNRKYNKKKISYNHGHFDDIETWNSIYGNNNLLKHFIMICNFQKQ